MINEYKMIMEWYIIYHCHTNLNDFLTFYIMQYVPIILHSKTSVYLYNISLNISLYETDIDVELCG